MKRLFFKIMIFSLLISTFTACSPKSGCPAEAEREKAIKANKKIKRDKNSNLFPKDMRKKMN